MVVDIDHEQRTLEHDRIGTDPALVRTIEREHNAVLEVIGQIATQLSERQEAVLTRQRRLAGEMHDDVLAELAQPERRAEHRAERVAVGILVREYEEALVGAERIDDRG